MASTHTVLVGSQKTIPVAPPYCIFSGVKLMADVSASNNPFYVNHHNGFSEIEHDVTSGVHSSPILGEFSMQVDGLLLSTGTACGYCLFYLNHNY